MKVLDCALFEKWLSQYRDYISIGGSQPLNWLPNFFKFEKNFMSSPTKAGMGSFILKCTWSRFQYNAQHDFHQEKNISYFSREIDFLEIRDNVALYSVNLNMEDHIGKIIFQMENIEEDNTLCHCRIFLPELDLIYVDKENMFTILYSQNQYGIGLPNSNGNLTKETIEGFYFNKPFFIHIYIDLEKVLSLYIDKSKEHII